MLNLFAQFGADGFHCRLDLVCLSNELFAGENCGRTECLGGVAGKRVKTLDAVYLVPEKFHTDRILGLSGANIHSVAAHAELPPFKGDIIARVLNVHQLGEEEFTSDLHALNQRNHKSLVILAIADTVNARHAGHHHHIAPAQ